MNNTLIQAMFPQVLSVKSLELDVNKISNFCYELKNSDAQGKIKSNRGGWQSNSFEMDSIQNLIIQNLEFDKFFNKINVAVNNVSQEMGIIPKLNINNLWININQYGNYNIPHLHSGSILSGVFYVKAPKNCGEIIFENPVGALMESYLHYSHLLDEIDYNHWTAQTCRVPCEENRLILFPSWIKHSVDQNLNETEDRISIAFNTERAYER